MATEQLADTVQWGNIVFSLENEVFREGFESGYCYYFEDAKGEEPQHSTKLSAGELLHRIALPDARTGHYRFDEEAIGHLEEDL